MPNILRIPNVSHKTKNIKGIRTKNKNQSPNKSLHLTPRDSAGELGRWEPKRIRPYTLDR